MRIAELEVVEGVAAGVPFVALPPADPAAPAALLAGWHLMEPPASERALAAALPMAGLQAWRVYFGLPLTGARLPGGGPAELFRLASEDAVLNVFGPVTDQAAGEFPAALAALRDRLPGADGPLGVFGGSAGSLVALEVLARGDADVAAGAIVSPVAQLAPVIGRNERVYDVTYPWSARSHAVAAHHDYVRRAAELSAPLLIVAGSADDIAVREPAAALRDRLGDRAELVTIDGMGHEFAEAPGLDAAPQTADAARVDAAFSAWFGPRLRR
ncbi:S9 family peptidase [Amycolatopsis sp. WQ 127309]|uniref:alpha/beta hydrolase family protein n=1 Tax=Amycolatopsis sp. WQ 127309 TaxID=2932773 RepID=UPI001FF578EC|nr:alpha/beta hydrolase [Amycolatopsis sp. WQ 127309]UOZ06017.1 alpha/beta hydrolase [Amycolatopsis sp. WQ 127309]